MSTVDEAEKLLSRMTPGEKAQLEQARRLGATEADLLHHYPGLHAEDLASAWAYLRAHVDEIDHQIRDHESA